MKANTKTIAVVAAILLTLAVAAGLKLKSLFRKPVSSPQASIPFGPYGQFGSTLPDMTKIGGDQAKLFELITKYKMKLRLANYIAQAQMQVVSQTDTSVHFVITYPDKATTDETITVAADPNYTPSPADLERAARTGSKVHGPKLTVKKTGPNQWQYTLQYHVPYSAIPSDLLQKLQPPSNSQRSSADFFDLVPSVHADGGVGAGEGAISVVANYFAEAYKTVGRMSTEGKDNAKSIGMDIPLALVDLADDLAQLKLWLDEMGKLQDCAKNPTNPLSQKATQDPNYQHDVLDPLSNAKGDVISTLAPTLASDTAGFVTHWLPFGSGAVVGLIFSTQDDAVSQYAEGRIEEARKYIVPCDVVPMTPGDLRPMQGALKYTYIFNDHEANETRKAEGKFDLNIVEGGLAGEGTAKFTYEYASASINPICQGIAETRKAKGDIKIKAEAGGSPLAGVIELHVDGDLPVVDDQLVSSGAKTCIQQTRTYTDHYNYLCHFDRVDMVHGGTFSAFAQDTGGRGTCTIELSRK
jgi:hypothetical protein